MTITIVFLFQNSYSSIKLINFTIHLSWGYNRISSRERAECVIRRAYSQINICLLVGDFRSKTVIHNADLNTTCFAADFARCEFRTCSFEKIVFTKWSVILHMLDDFTGRLNTMMYGLDFKRFIKFATLLVSCIGGKVTISCVFSLSVSI